MNSDGPGDLQECGNGSEYGSGSEETAALLSRPSATPILVAAPSTSSSSGSNRQASQQHSSNTSLPAISASGTATTPAPVTHQVSKPILQRQDRATYLVASPELSVSGLGGSEESGASAEDPATRSVPDIELHCRLDLDHQPVQQSSHTSHGHYRQRHGHQYRCRCDRRDSLAPSSALHLARSVSK